MANNRSNYVLMRIHQASKMPSVNNKRGNKNKLDSLSPHELWEQQYISGKIKCTFLILMYLYSQDDNEISSREDKSIQRFLKKNRTSLFEKDFETIKQFSVSILNYTTITDYVIENKVNEKMILESVLAVERIIKSKKVYSNLLDNLKRDVLSTIRQNT